MKEEGKKLLIFCNFFLKLCTLNVFSFVMLSAKDVLFSLSHEIEEDTIELADTCPVEI